MKRNLLTVVVVILLIFNFLAFTNPSEKAFLEKVATEYGQLHGGINLRPADLMEMGKSERKSYLFFSLYSYEFGNIGVNYVGIAGSTLHIRSFNKKEESQESDIKAI